MKKSDEIRRKTWRMLAKNLIVLAALALAAVVGVMSWFTKTAKATAEGIYVQASVANGLEIAVAAPGSVPADSDYVEESLTLSKTAKAGNPETLLYPFLKDLSFCEVTGDGKTFQKPILTQENGVAHANVDSQDPWLSAEANVDYLSFDLYMRSRNQLTVKLANNSMVTPVNALMAGEGYSKDSVIGAVRMSMLDASDEKLLVWLPAPHVHYDGNYSSDTFNTVSLSSPSTSDTWKHFYYDSTRVLRNYNSDDNSSFFVASPNADYKLARDFQVAQLSYPGSGSYYTAHVRINLWIEGQDDEARLAMVNGKFKLKLELITE